MKNKMIWFRDFFTEQKFRLDLGRNFLTYINFMLLIVAASDKIQTKFVISTKLLVLIILPIGFIGSWAFGYFLDVFVKFPQKEKEVSESRSPYWQEIRTKLDKLLEIVGDDKEK